MSLIQQINNAIASGKKEEYEKLIMTATKEQLMQYEQFDYQKITPLDKASQVADIYALQLLLAKGLDINCKNAYDGLAPLHSLIYCKDTIKRHEAIDFMVSAGADINLPTSNATRQSALHLCIARLKLPGYRQTFDRLLKYPGVNINQTDRDGKTPLDEALEKDHEAAHILTEKGASRGGANVQNLTLNRISAQQRDQNIYNLVRFGRVEVARSYGVYGDPNTQSFAPLSFPTETVNSSTPSQPQITPIDTSKISQEAYAIGNSQTGETNFHLAIRANDVSKLCHFLAIDHIPILTDLAFNTVYHTAAAHGNHMALAALHARYKEMPFNPFPAYFQLKNLEGNTSLHLAVISKHLNCIMFLIEQGCSLQFPNNQGQTAFQMINNDAQLLAELMKSKVAERLKAVLSGNSSAPSASSASAPPRIPYTFSEDIFTKKQNDGDIATQVAKLVKITEAAAKSGNVPLSSIMVLKRQTPQVLAKYLQQLNAREDSNQSAGISKLITSVEELVADMKKEQSQQMAASPSPN